jgi:hypothetical protein
VPVSKNSARPNASQPPQWWPRTGWETVRGYQAENKGNGRADLRFYFVPDDGSEPQFFELADHGSCFHGPAVRRTDGHPDSG